MKISLSKDQQMTVEEVELDRGQMLDVAAALDAADLVETMRSADLLGEVFYEAMKTGAMSRSQATECLVDALTVQAVLEDVAFRAAAESLGDWPVKGWDATGAAMAQLLNRWGASKVGVPLLKELGREDVDHLYQLAFPSTSAEDAA